MGFEFAREDIPPQAYVRVAQIYNDMIAKMRCPTLSD